MGLRGELLGVQISATAVQMVLSGALWCFPMFPMLSDVLLCFPMLSHTLSHTLRCSNRGLPGAPVNDGRRNGWSANHLHLCVLWSFTGREIDNRRPCTEHFQWKSLFRLLFITAGYRAGRQGIRRNQISRNTHTHNSQEHALADRTPNSATDAVCYFPKLN